MLRLIYITVVLLFLLAVVSRAVFSENTARSYFEEGIDLNKQRRYDEALEKFTRAVALDLESHIYHQSLFMTYIATRRGPQAIQFYKDLIKEHPKSAASHYWLGRLYLESQLLNDSVPEFREATRLAPPDEHPLISLGHVYLRLGKNEEALKTYLEANNLSPHVAVVHAGLGSIYFDRKDYVKAEKEYDEALKIDPSLTEARYNLSLIYEKKGDFPKAVKQWQMLLDEDPNESRARERLARIYFRGGQYGDAVREYSMLSQVKQNSPEVFLALGESQVMLASTLTDPAERNQLKNSAVQAFQRTLELDPSNVQARRYLNRLNSKNLPLDKNDDKK